MRSQCASCRTTTATSSVLLCLLASLAAGCGPAKGTLSGQVRYQGVPLPGGRLTFRPADPQFNPVIVQLDEEGHYEAVVPAGEVSVSVDNRELLPRTSKPVGAPADLPPQVRDALAQNKPPAASPSPNGNSTTDKPRGRYVPIPPRYYTIESSGLKFTVEPGSHEHDIELKLDP